MTAHQVLEKHAEELRHATGLEVETHEGDGNRIFVVMRSVVLPAGLFAVERSDALFIADRQYPLSALDMFWLEVTVVGPNGVIPRNADAIESYASRQWRRFSWHRNNVWNPAGNGLLDHFAFMEARWAAEARR